MNILFHVQHLLGIGHDRRAALIAEGLSAAGHRVTLARGGHPVAGTGHGGGAVIQLPPVRAADSTFKVLLDEHDHPIDDAWRQRRREAALRAFDEVAPDVLLVESFPFARRAFRFELVPLLERARATGVLTACSVRDILVAKTNPSRVDEAATVTERLIDRVLVHGDPALIPFDATFPAADRIAGRIRYTGYVAGPRTPHRPGPVVDGADQDGPRKDGWNEVLVSVGGGAVGLPLLTAALGARALSPASDAVWRLLAGPDLPGHAVAALAANAPPGVVVERARPDFPDLLRRCRLSISQAGYNTVLDVLQAGCRAVLVPFAAGSETEQPIRARLLAERGRATVVPEVGLTPRTLADGVARALAAPDAPELELAMDGAARTGALLAEALAAR